MIENSAETTGTNESLSWKDFSAKLKSLWERDGDISESLNVIEAHPTHKKNTGRTGRQQILRVLGEDRLLSGEVKIPERVDSPVYELRPDRVMYCVYSTPVFNSNGYSTRSRGVAAGLKAAGADVVVVARAGYPWDWKIDTLMPKRERIVSVLDDIDYVHLPNGAMNLLSPSAHIEQTADAFVQEALIQRPSYIQAASNYRVAMPALIAARRLGIPFIYEVRGLWEVTGASNNPGFEETDRYFAMRDYESRVARAADHVFAITDQVRQELISRGVESSKITLAPNAVDPEKFYPQAPNPDMALSLGLDPSVPVIGFAGSVVKYEGLHTLLRASLVLREKGIEHQVAIAGSGNAEASLKSFASTNHMDWVNFLGRIPQEQVPELLSISSIIVTPRDSTVVTELVSALKPLEAFAAGRSVVLSDVAPNLDLAGENEARAKIFAAGDSDNMACVLEQLLEEPSERIKIAKAARVWIEGERSWLKVGQQMIANIKKVGGAKDSADPFSIRTSDLRIGVLGSNRIQTEIAKNIKVMSNDQIVQHPEMLSDLDFMLVDLSSTSNGMKWEGAKMLVDETVESRLQSCKNEGVPCVGILAEGLSGSVFEPKLLGLLNMILVGNYDGVLDLLEDPQAVNLTVGILPPVLFEGTKGVGNFSEDFDSVVLVDSSGLTIRPIDTIIEFLDPEFTMADDMTTSLAPPHMLDQEGSIGAIYIRASAHDDVVREVISQFGLKIPIIWERRSSVSNWFGDLFVADMHPIEFIALVNQWSLAPQSRSNFVEKQRNQLLASHSLETWLPLLSRSLGIPVAGKDFGISTKSASVEDENPSYTADALVSLLENEAATVAPLIIKSLRKYAGGNLS